MMMLLRLFLSVLSLASVLWALPCEDGKIRGVNLGGLFLLEPFIAPTIFEEANAALGEDLIIDEWTYHQYVDPEVARERLERHWDEFYSRAELEILANSGISHIRIPVGYWLVDVAEDEPFPPPPATDEDGQRFYLKRILGWCESLGLKVLIDLHGAPGSQNGYNHSGRAGDINWIIQANVERTLEVLDKLAQLMVDWIADGTISDTTLHGIAMLNEPQGWREDLWDELMNRFHYNAYDVIRAHLIDDVMHKVVIQAAFRPSSDFIDYMPESEGYFGVGLDLHNYQCFESYWNDLAGQPEGWGLHLEAACNYAAENSGMTLETVVGEWSLAVCECQKYLTGYRDPYYNTASESTCEYYNGDITTYPEDLRDFLRDFMRAQMDSYESTLGWFFWTGKIENHTGPEWDYLQLLEYGIAPADLCSRPRYCP